MLFVVAIPFLTPSSYIHNVLILTFLVAVIGSGWNVMSGFTGYVSLGHSMFIGVGAYTAGILATRWEVSPFLVAPLGGIAAALVALAARAGHPPHPRAGVRHRHVRDARAARPDHPQLVRR